MLNPQSSGKALARVRIQYFQVLSDPVETCSSYYLEKRSSAFGELQVSYAHIDPFPGGIMHKTLCFLVVYEEAQDH